MFKVPSKNIIAVSNIQTHNFVTRCNWIVIYKIHNARNSFV